jgi:uracil-DNA glycosylase
MPAPSQANLWGGEPLAHSGLQWPLVPPPGAWGDAWGWFEQQPGGHALLARLAQRLDQGATVYPHDPLWVLRLTPLESVKVVILGQDPYHGPGQAQGLAFSVAPGVKVPPSLRNIFKELQRDLGTPAPADGSLERWAHQGVLLLNTCLTVEDGRAAAHAGWGWELFTDEVIRRCCKHAQPKVFVLWGSHAQKKRDLIGSPHAVLAANHPSPLSATRGPEPFMGCGHFGEINRWLSGHGHTPIDW